MTKTYLSTLKACLLVQGLLLPLFVFSQNGQSKKDIPETLAKWSTKDSRPNYLKLQKEAKFKQKDLLNLLNEGKKGKERSVFKLKKTKKGKKDKTRYIYEQTYLDLPVENHHWILHEQGDYIVLAQGQFAKTNENHDTTPVFTPDQAREIALESANAREYAWEIPALEQILQEALNDPMATYYPSGELVWFSSGQGRELELVYKFDIYALDPATRKNYYVSATTGRMIKAVDLISTSCFEHNHGPNEACHEALPNTANFTPAEGTGIARYIDFNNGVVDFSTDFNGTDYSLDYTSPEIDIRTQSANNQWNYSNLTDYFDADNYWDTLPIAISAHWGSERVYDYFLQEHGRDSYDGEGSPIINIVNYGQDYPNAFWDGVKMTYGDGDGTAVGSFTSLDLIAHEIAHGVTETSVVNGLVYQDESGALNESFSDIFGSVIEFHVFDALGAPQDANWMIGEDFDFANGMGLRNMEDPHELAHPKAYLGEYWHDEITDFGGVHINSSVQNHWFYLLCEGGIGTNEFGYEYNITPIGIEKATNIVYHNLTTYITSNSTYLDAKDGSLDAALDLYESDVSVYNAIQEAWCAVGIGTGCGPSIEINNPILEEKITSGFTYTVVWDSPLISSTSLVKIEYTTEEGDNPIWKFIASNVPNDTTGTYDWVVPNDYSNTVRVRVTDEGDPATGREGNSDLLGLSEVFEIVPCIDQVTFDSPSLINVGTPVNFIGTIEGANYQWEINGEIVGSNKNLTDTFSVPGIYDITYSLSNTAGTCSSEKTKRLYVVTDNSNGFSVQVAGPNSGGGRAYGQEIIETSDGGFVFISLFSPLVFKIDALGNEVWTSSSLPSPSNPNYRLTAIEKSDGNILIVMGREESGSTNQNLLLIEVDGTNGNIVNSMGKQLATDGILMPYKIIATDTSYLIGGGYQNGIEKNIFVVQLNAADLSIEKQLWVGDNNRSDFFGDLIATESNGGFLLGWIQSGTNPQHFALMKLDENLQLEWKEGLANYKFFTGSRSRIQLKEIPNCEGYMVLADGDEYANSALLKLNTLGNISWVKRYNTPDFFNGQLISFQDMVGDGNNGVTMIGINGTTLHNGYPETVDYQLINVGFDGQINWTRKVTGLDLILPSAPNYNLIVTKILLAADGGYLISLPGGDGGETHLVKTDSLGIDCCVMANTNIAEEDITSSFYTNLSINTTLSTPPVIASAADYSFNIGAPITLIYPPKCTLEKNSVIAAFKIESRTIPINTTPEITDISRDATAYIWRVDGNQVSFPLPDFTQTGMYTITLEAIGANSSSFSSTTIEVIDDTVCEIPCDLVKLQARPIDASCPNTDDGELYAEVSSAIGRTFRFDLYDDEGNFISTQVSAQNTGHFRNLPTGDYQMFAVADNDESCQLDLGLLQLVPKADTNPPQVYCQNEEVDVAFVHAAVGLPWNHQNYIIELNSAFGDAWHELIYEEVDANKLFSDSYNYIYLEGTDNNANEMEDFLTANQQLMEDWVAAGNSLFLNAGPREGNGMSFGFGGVNLVTGSYEDAFARKPIFPIFTGPRLPILTELSDDPYSYGAVIIPEIIPENMDTTRVLVSTNGTDLVVKANWGDGQVLFGGLNLTGYGAPSIAKTNVKVNMHLYLSSVAIPTLNSPIEITLNNDHQYILSIDDLSLGADDDCGLQSVSIDQTVFSCMDIGIHDINLIATDEANNQGVCATKIEVLAPEPTEIDSIICQGDPYIFNDQNLTISGVYSDTLMNTLGCDSIIVLNLSVSDTSQTQIDTTICQGDFFTFNGLDLTDAGTYRDTLVNAAQCDSFLVLNLTLLDTSQTVIDTAICQGDFFTFNGDDLTTAGIYRDTLLNETQCDSFIVLNLAILGTSQTLIDTTICQGDFFTFNGDDLSESGTYINTLMNAVQCDSVVTLVLTVNDTSQTVIDTTICQGDFFNFNRQDLTTAGTYRDTLLNEAQCDSFLVLNLTLLDTVQTIIDTTICQGDFFTFNGQDLMTAGTYRDTLLNTAQCDSFLVLNLTLFDTSQTVIDTTICQGDFFTFNGQDLMTAGTYRDTLLNTAQCDSFLVLNLAILGASQTLIDTTICQGDFFTFNGEDLTESGTYINTLMNAAQCDSVITLALTVNDTSQTIIDTTICQGNSYTFNGQELTTTGIYRDTLVNAAQCDSFVILNLTIADQIEATASEVICQGEGFTFNNQVLTSTGIYRDTIPNAAQCDSIIILTLTVNDTSQTVIDTTICQGDFLTFNGQDLTTAGTYRDTLKNEAQCDSFLVLNLAILDASQTFIDTTICQGDFFTFNGEDLTTADIYRDTLLNAAQCDSIIILDLKVNATSENLIDASICQGESYTFKGQTLTTTGIYRDTLLNTLQCDSFVILDLTVSDTAQTVIFESICEGDTYLFNEVNLSIAGQYRDTLTTTTQCDSFVVLNLSVATCSDCSEPILILNNTPIQKGIYKAEISILSSGETAVDTVVYQAGESILLSPGFHVPAGSEFLAFIDPTTCETPGSLTEEAPSTTQQLKQSAPTIPLDKNSLKVSPNPFLNKTKIEYHLGTPQQVRLAVYSMEGQLIEVLTEGDKALGAHSQYFEANGSYKGLFLVILQTEKEVLTQKIISLE